MCLPEKHVRKGQETDKHDVTSLKVSAVTTGEYITANILVSIFSASMIAVEYELSRPSLYFS